MLILSQTGQNLLNVENIQSLYISRKISSKSDESGKKIMVYVIIARFDSGHRNFTELGEYFSEECAKEILRSIFKKYGEGVSIIPKFYEMPQE